MSILKDIITTILGFKSYVLLPIIMLALSTIIGLKFQKAIKASITLGIGFVGIFIVFDYFVAKVGPVLKVVIARTGIKQNVMEVGWTPFAGVAWSFKLVPLLILLILVINIIMLFLKLTNTINIDIWNFWHFIFAAQLVYYFTNSAILSCLAASFLEILCIKFADWSVKDVEALTGMRGISITTLSAQSYYSFGVFMDKVFDKIPILKDLEANPESLKNKLGFCGEPMFLGIVMGAVLGIAAGYPIKDILDISITIAAVIYILPKMTAILGEGLMPISDGMKEYMLKKFPEFKDTNIGLDSSLIIGNPAVIVTGILLMPVALVLSFVLPGIKFIPLGDLPNTIGAVVMIVVAMRGNVVRSFIAGIPIIIGTFYVSSYMAETLTLLAKQTGYKIVGYDGLITSCYDGGNILRFWCVKLFSGNLWTLAFIPVAAFLIYFTYRTKKQKV